MGLDNYNSSLYENKEIGIKKTKIPGLLSIDLVLNGDERGWFKENFQREKLVAQGFPRDFQPIQMNVSANKERGVTRGIHAEPWNKYISIQSGKIFTAIVDLRKGKSFGVVETLEMTPGKAMYVPKGCGNAFQTLTSDVLYTYLVDAHWSPEAKYTLVNLADPELNISWPIPLNEAIISDKDKGHPLLKDLTL
ncbi:MAG: dTDP-4-dehydrorhamnose 3,5-epimerase family protein [Patescibacteria group bacterium]